MTKSPMETRNSKLRRRKIDGGLLTAEAASRNVRKEPFGIMIDQLQKKKSESPPSL